MYWKYSLNQTLGLPVAFQVEIFQVYKPSYTWSYLRACFDDHMKKKYDTGRILKVFRNLHLVLKIWEIGLLPHY